MPAPAWDLAWIPRRESEQTTQARVDELRFQNAEQRVPIGIDNLDDVFPLTFREHVSVIEQMEAFLRARRGSESFTFTDQSIPGSPKVYRVVCKSWRRSPAGGTSDFLRVVFSKVSPEWP